uniref:Uncharacterized protein n=1 Tax=Arundo donax TaxID=35708 RepID=A0A0A9DCJ5_ARUDO
MFMMPNAIISLFPSICSFLINARLRPTAIPSASARIPDKRPAFTAVFTCSSWNVNCEMDRGLIPFFRSPTIGMPCSFPLTRKAKTPPMTTTMKGAMTDTQNRFGFFFLR